MRKDKLDELIDALPPYLKEFVFFKHPELKFHKGGFKTEEQLMKATGRRTMGTFNKFERSATFQKIEIMILQRQVGKDIIDIYEIVKEKALAGDRLAIADLLKLSKAIDQIVKQADEEETKDKEVVEEIEEDDDLI